jgi:NDP-sugar pyrophosphorylase family protein
MKAMILAAGFGTRLRPLTDKKPKALVPIANKPLIARVIGYLKSHGVNQIIVNAHHHHEQLSAYLDRGKPFGLPIEVRVEPEILGTGGGVKNTEDFWDGDGFVVINTDILTDIHLGRAYEHHKKSGALATLVLHDCAPYNQVQIDGDRHVVGIDSSPGPGRLAFTGIHIMNREFLNYLPATGYSKIMDSYRMLIRSGKPIGAFLSRRHAWLDAGNLESYKVANRELAENSILLGTGCSLDPSAKLEPWVVVGDNCRLEARVEIRNSILWENAAVKRNIKIMDSIVTSRSVVKNDLIGDIL